MCYNRLDYYDVSLEILAPYLQQFPDSTIATNLKVYRHGSPGIKSISLTKWNRKACNHFRLYDGRAAEEELKPVLDAIASSSNAPENELIKHNLVVFRQGENALQVLQPLVGILPEARLNLVIFYLKNKDVDEAFKLMQNVEPTTPIEYILKVRRHH
jgi:intraflagellar transport protein 56